MAGAYTNQNSKFLESRIDRTPTPGELYMAHFLGAADAAKLIELSGTRPNRKAWRDFPAAARSNRSIFYDGRRARTVREVYIVLQNKVVSQVETRVSPKTANEPKARPTRKPTKAPYIIQASASKSALAHYTRKARPVRAPRPKRVSLQTSKTKRMATAMLLRGSLGIPVNPDTVPNARKIVGSSDPWITQTEVMPGNAKAVRIRRKKRSGRY